METPQSDTVPEQTPTEETPAEQTPVEQSPVEQAAVEQAQAEATPTDEAPSEAAPSAPADGPSSGQADPAPTVAAESDVEPASTMKWYAVHTYSGHENKVRTYVESAKEGTEFAARIGRVVVPTEEVVEMRDGRKTTSQKKFLPSYILIEMEMDKETMHFVTNVPGVTSFVGPGRRPQPLRRDEVQRVLGQIDRRPVQEEQEIPYSVGDRVKVIDGPFSDFVGLVDDVNPEKSKIKVMVSIFGRNTPVELDVLQVEVATEPE